MKELKIEELRDEDVLLDLRAKEDFLKASIPGAIYLPFSNLVHFLAPLIETDESLVFLVNSQEEALFLEEFTRNLGYENIRGYLTQALDQWQAAGRDLKVWEKIEALDFDENLLEAGDVLLDVRNRVEIKEGDPEKNRVILPLKDLGDDYASLDRQKKYYILCVSGNRATVAASFLARKGYDTVVIDGGVSALGTC